MCSSDLKELRGQIAPMAFYVHQDWETSQVLPWHHIHGALPQSTLVKHLESATAQFNDNHSAID